MKKDTDDLCKEFEEYKKLINFGDLVNHINNLIKIGDQIFRILILKIFHKVKKIYH